MVQYCNAACKKKHRSKHKKACERRVAELHDEELFKEPPLPEECPICFLTLPFHERQAIFKSCCGKLICNGCIYAMREEARGRGEIGLCAFCREPKATSEEEDIKRTKKLMETDNSHAFYALAGAYETGNMGMPQDMTKANELYLKAGELGCTEAYYNLGVAYNNGRGVEVDMKKAEYYFELAAMRGCTKARFALGCYEGNAGNEHRAFKHFILAAKAGHKKSLDQVKKGFMHGIVTKDGYANALRAYQSRQGEMKSEDRDRAALLSQIFP